MVAIKELPPQVDITNNLELYKADLGEVKLLTREEEKILGKKIDQGNIVMSFQAFLNVDARIIPIVGSRDVTESVCRAIGLSDSIKLIFDTSDEESKSETVVALEITNPLVVRQQLETPRVQRHLAFLIKKAKEAKETLIKRNLPLSISVAKEFIFPGLVSPGAELLDLIQEGNMGLKKAVDKYQWWRENKFSTYARWWIRAGIKRFIYNNGKIIRYPEEVQKDLVKLEKAEEEYLETTGTLPTEEKLSESSGVPRKRIRYIREINEILEHTESLDAPKFPHGEDESTVGDFVPDEEANTEEAAIKNVMQQELRKQVEEVLAEFSGRDREILRMRLMYGLDYKEIAKEFDVSYQMVQQIVARVLKKLREDSETVKKLLPWYEKVESPVA